MVNLRKVVLFLVTTGILIYSFIKIGILLVLIASVMFIIALAVLIVWAKRPRHTHRNKLQGFNLTFESKRIEFTQDKEGLYTVSLATKYDSGIKGKDIMVATKNKDGGTTYHWQDVPKQVRREFFITVPLSEKRLTERQATDLYFQLLQASKKHSVVNAVYISNLIKSINTPLQTVVESIQKIKGANRRLQAQVQAKKAMLPPSPPLSSVGAEANLAKNGLSYVILFAINTTNFHAEQAIKDATLMLPNETYATNFKLLIIILVILKFITVIRTSIANFSNVQITGKCPNVTIGNKGSYAKDIFQ
jgi:hypothetical protein